MAECADGATTRRNRILDMLRYVQTRMPIGATNLQVSNYMGLQHGLRSNTAQGYIGEMIRMGLLRPAANYLVLDEPEFNKWLEILGLSDPDVQMVCQGCGSLYSSAVPSCPGCGSSKREIYDPRVHTEERLSQIRDASHPKAQKAQKNQKARRPRVTKPDPVPVRCIKCGTRYDARTEARCPKCQAYERELVKL